MLKRGRAVNEYSIKHLPEVLGDYEKQNGARFHMPGHKGRGMAGFWRPSLLKWDVTELSVTDDLHAPTDMLLRAQADCALAFGAADSFFLVNGATAGILAMLLSLPAGSHVLLGRDCHRSAISGLILAGHHCSFVYPAREAEWGVTGVAEASAIDAALSQESADAVLVTSPNYYGLCADIAAISAVCKRHGALLMVDASHGAHFPFAVSLPESPAAYADMWTQSAHKTLNALGQAALLHRAAECPIPKERIQYALSMAQTSSPSFLLMASLDWARYSACVRQDWDAAVALCKTTAQQIDGLPGLHTLPESLIGSAGIAAMDPTRLVIDVSARGITGYAASESLEAANVYVELADARRIACICTPSDDPVWYPMLLKGLKRLPHGTAKPAPQPEAWQLPKAKLSPREAAGGETELVLLTDAPGRTAAEAAGSYPPGIPLFIPGEEITTAAVTMLTQQCASGAGTFGLRNGRVWVVKE